MFKTFPPQDQNLEQIRGPLIIEGGLGVGRGESKPAAAGAAAGETNAASAQESSNPVGEPGGIDTLNIFHTDNSDADVGRLYYRTVDALNHTIRNPGLALTGFEMGGDLTVNQGSARLRTSSTTAAASPTTASRSSKSCSARATRR